MADQVTLDDVEPYEPVEVPEATGYETPGEYTPAEEDLVSGQMTGLLSSGSKYIQSARESGEAYGQSRGLLNSSISAGASEKSAIDAALPIAQQDSATLTAAGMQENQGEIQGALNTQNYGNDAGILNVQGAASSQLSAQDAAQESSLAIYTQDRTMEFNKMMAQMDISANEQSAITSSITTLGDNLQAKIAGIQIDPNLSQQAKAKAIKSVQSAFEANISSIGNIYGVKISW